MSLKKNVSVRPNKLIKDDQEISDPKLIANEFNNYFATIGSRLAAEIPNCVTCTHTAYLDDPYSSSFLSLFSYRYYKYYKFQKGK